MLPALITVAVFLILTIVLPVLSFGRASAALVETLPKPIVSNACCSRGSGSAPRAVLSMARTVNSFVPHPAGIRPTPTSTWPR